jgi:D-inositol-3-phosphate glycosyltransferase
LGAETAARGSLDAPAPGSEVRAGFVQIVGWAQCGATALARVEIEIDGKPAGLARIGQLRHDVVEALGDGGLLWCGFEHVVELQPGAVEIAAVAHSLDGSSLRLSTEIRVSIATAQPEAPQEVARPRSRLRAAWRRPRHTRVLVVGHSLARGGAELSVLELVQQLAPREDFTFSLLSPSDGPLRESFEAADVAVDVLGRYPTSSVALYEMKTDRIAAIARERRCDVVLVNTMAAFCGVDAAARAGLPAVWAIHEGWGPQLFWETFYPPGELHPHVGARGRRALRSAAATVFVCDTTRRLFEPWVAPSSTATIPYGIDFTGVDGAGSRARGGLGLPDDAQVLLAIGPIVPPKCQSMLVSAFTDVARRRDDVHLVLLGDSPALYASALRDWVASIGLNDRVHFETAASALGELYRAADWLVVASDVESLPRTIVEAFAWGLPVVATSVGGIPELVDGHSTGYLCPPRDAEALREAIERALGTDPVRRRQLAAAGAAATRGRHDPRVCADTWADLLHDTNRRWSGS